MERRVNLVYLMGAGRSGTTVLATLLGEHANISSRGELIHLPAMIEDDALCSCGESMSNCLVWHSIYEKWLRRTQELCEAARAERHSYILRWLLPFHGRRAARYLATQSELLHTMQKGAGGWLLDSSKYVARALLLHRLSDLNLKVLYVTRDCRGVIHSFGKAVQTSRQPLSAAAYYMLVNLAAWVSRATVLRHQTLHVRYEDLVAKPVDTLARIGAFLELDFSSVIHRLEEGAAFPVGHIAGGNRLKHEERVRLRPDYAWKDALPRWRQWLYYVLCLPVQLLNGYRP